MRTVAIIAEYNPFHNGHQYHIQTAKKQLNADFVLVVMSGNFVQRGEPAIIHKWKRTEMCLLGGADLVLELPVAYATASAEFFASAGVGLLNQSNVVSHISFGAESSTLSEMQTIARILCTEPPAYKKQLRHKLDLGLSFPQARAQALADLLPSADEIIHSPNNILAIEYLKALEQTKSPIRPHLIERKASSHNATELEGAFSSASAIRNALKASGISHLRHCIPPESYEILLNSADAFPIDIDDFSDMLLYRIKTMPSDVIRHIFDVSEGLENRIYQASSLERVSSIIAQIKTKRYTFTKIQRILMHILLNITQEQIALYQANGGGQYLRVLGFKKNAVPLLKKLKQISSLPVLVNLKKDAQALPPLAHRMLEQEILADDIYFIKAKNPAWRTGRAEYTFPPVII